MSRLLRGRKAGAFKWDQALFPVSHKDAANSLMRPEKEIMAINSAMVGAAGVYYVAARLNAMELHCAPTFGNVPSVDIIVSSLNGSAQISLQVKTTMSAMRARGRGRNKQDHHYEWEIGWKSAVLNFPNLFFALVDLKEFRELPDVYIVPSNITATYFALGPENWPRARYHPLIRDLAPFKNDWDTIKNRLAVLDTGRVV